MFIYARIIFNFRPRLADTLCSYNAYCYTLFGRQYFGNKIARQGYGFKPCSGYSKLNFGIGMGRDGRAACAFNLCNKIILERSEPTKPLAQMLAGRLPFK